MRYVLVLFAVVLGICLMVWGWDRLGLIYWVGHADLEVEFAVQDSQTGAPLSGATITVVCEGGFPRERDQKKFSLTTDEVGVARRICHEMMTSGTQSGLRFTDSYFVRLPAWLYQVSAQGYHTTDWTFVDERENLWKVDKSDRRKPRLVIRVAMEKVGV